MNAPMQFRAAGPALETLNKEARTVDVVFSSGAAFRRADFWTGKAIIEELAMDAANVRMDRLRAGAPLLNSHQSFDLSSVVGVVEKAWLDGGKGYATVRFHEGDQQSEDVWRKVANGIVRNVSVGYLIHKVEKRRGKTDQEPDLWRVVDWEPVEISAVAVPADPGAAFRAAQEFRSTVEIVDIEDSPAGPLVREGEVIGRYARMLRLAQHRAR